jgi:class 3 adenylate cyclase
MTDPCSRRKLTAILSADAVGYSRLMAADEAATVETLKAYRDIIVRLVARHGGRVVNAPGDALFLDLNGATDTTLNTIPLGGRVYQFSNRRKISFYEMESYQSAPAELEATVSPALLGIVKLESIAQQIFRDG